MMLIASKFTSGLPNCKALARSFVLPEQALNLKMDWYEAPATNIFLSLDSYNF